MEKEIVVKWNTGKPKHTGKYLVTDKYGSVDTDVFTANHRWLYREETDVIAWCELITIKPYKE